MTDIFIFTAHNLSEVKHISDHMVLIHVGKLVGTSNTHKIFNLPKQPYPAVLMMAVSASEPRVRIGDMEFEGKWSALFNLLTGHYFYPRCTSIAERSWTETPVWWEIVPEHFVRRIRAGELNLPGIDLEKVSIHDDAGVVA